MSAEEKQIQCVGFIMDGNRRWAKSRGLPTFEGHAKGYGILKDVIDIVHRAHIPHMVCYAFSTENWNRSEEEVSYLMSLLEKGVEELGESLSQDVRKINLHVIGQLERLPETLQAKIKHIVGQHHSDPELSVWLAISYGGRAEILHAVNTALLRGEVVTETTFGQLLWTNGMPDPDLIIRTSGEQRISNFLLWQSAYSEYVFTDTLWPDFGETEFKSILEAYAGRKRRKGK